MLEREVLNESTEAFCKGIVKASISLYESVLDFTRNIQNQVWLQRFNQSLENYGQFLLQTDAIWECNGCPRRLYLMGHEIIINIISDSEYEKRYITQRKWVDLGKHINENKKSKTEEIFIANSLEYLESENTRMAILESVIALEHYIKDKSCTNISHLIEPEEFEYIKRLLIKKHQFSIPIGLILVKLKKGLTKNKISAEAINESIELRNQIMHSSQKEVKYAKARKCVYSIRDFIAFLKSNHAN